jgi:glycopeptide antibiotics resistance protein
VFHGVYLLAIVVPVLLARALTRVRRGAPRGRVWLETAFALYLLFVLVIVLFPLRVSPALRADDAVWDYATFIRDWVNLVPLASVKQVLAYGWPHQAIRQLGGNLVLLLPLGVFVPALFPRFRHAASILALSFAAGVGIEALQYLARVARYSLRSVDIDDAILNMAGALIGYSLWRVWAHTRRKLAQRKQVPE